MMPLAVANTAGNVVSQALKVTGIFGQSEGFKSRQAVRDEYYATLNQAATYFKSKGEAGTRALTYMNAVYADNGSARTPGEGPNAAHLSALKTWANQTYGELEAGTSVNQAAVGGGALTAKVFGIPVWLLIGGTLAAAWFFFGRKRG